MFKRLLIILLSLLSCCWLAEGQTFESGVSYGLTFKSYEVTQDERTSLNLTSHKKVDAKEGFRLEFDINIVPRFAFGYIFRFIDDNLNHIDLVSNHDLSKFNFVVGNKDKIISNKEFDIRTDEEWHHISIAVNADDGRLIYEIDKDKSSVESPEIHDFGKFELLFGRIDNDRYFSTDLPHFTIRDIRLYDSKDRIRAIWPMDCHTLDAAYDTLQKKKALVRNGIWDIDRHLSWHLEKSIDVPVNTPQIAYSEDGSQLFIVSDDKVTTYNTISGKTTEVSAVSGAPFNAIGSHLVYDKKTNALLSYFPSEEKISKYNFETREWNNPGGEVLIHEQHGRYLDDSERLLYTFGGYGHHLYSNSLYIANIDSGVFKQTTLPIPPRYLCAMGKYSGMILILGGFGSLSGRQEEDPQNFYDIWSIDKHSFKCSKLVTLQKIPDFQYTFSHSFIPDEKDGCVYALIFNNDQYNSKALLTKINVNTGNLEQYADPIPFKFLDIRASCDLFLCKETSKLYAILSEVKGDVGSEIMIYSIAFPPLHEENVIIKPPKRLNIPLMIAGFLLLSMSYIGFAIARSKKKPGKDDLPDFTIRPIKMEKSYIRLLGEFTVVDHNGNDITKQFSPILKQILSYILLVNFGDGVQVSQSKLDEIFWQDMEHKNALNNRRVNLSKLRSILMLLGNIDLVSEQNKIDLQWDDNVFCDYKELLKSLKEVKEQGGNKDEIQHTLSIAVLGPLLPDVNEDWCDNYKSNLTWALENLMLGKWPEKSKEDMMLLVNMSDMVLMYDPIDENAISIKCRALYKLGHKGLSKSIFDSFEAAYKNILDQDPNIQYRDIIA
jgi:DNA-binding SARP family transcriptional activator